VGVVAAQAAHKTLTLLPLLNTIATLTTTGTILLGTKHMRFYSPPRYRVMLVKESLAYASAVTIRDSQTVYRLLVPLFDGLDREHFLVVGLDAKHAVIGINTVSIGSVTMSIVHPREVFKPLILMNASAVLLSHNHPSGDATPSPEDRALTRRLKDGGELLGIAVLDHLVLGEDRYYSFADHQEL